jgi:hypothetical protein
VIRLSGASARDEIAGGKVGDAIADGNHLAGSAIADVPAGVVEIAHGIDVVLRCHHHIDAQQRDARRRRRAGTRNHERHRRRRSRRDGDRVVERPFRVGARHNPALLRFVEHAERNRTRVNRSLDADHRPRAGGNRDRLADRLVAAWRVVGGDRQRIA